MGFASVGYSQLGAYLRRTMKNVEIRVVDQRATDYTNEEVVSRAVEFAPDVVGLSCTTPNCNTLSRVEQRDSSRLAPGPADDWRPACFGFWRRSDGYNLRGLCRDGGRRVDVRARAPDLAGRLPGLQRRARSGVAQCGWGVPDESRLEPVIQDLDALPFPAYDLIDLRSYWRLWSMSIVPPPRRYVAMFTSRGCPYGCIYCHDIFGKRFRAQSPERIVDELEHYVRTYGIKEVEFFDDIFNLQGRRVIEFSELVRRRNLKVSIYFPNAIRTDILTEDVAEAMADAGTRMSALALESGSPRIQKLVCKHLNIPKYLDGVAMLAKRRVFTYGFIMFGFPTETEADMQMTVDVVRQSKLHVVYPWVVTPYPKTELFEVALRLKPEKMAGINYAGHDYVVYPCVNLSEVSDKVLKSYLFKSFPALFANPLRALRIVRDFPRPWSVWRYWEGVLTTLTSKKAVQLGQAPSDTDRSLSAAWKAGNQPALPAETA